METEGVLCDVTTGFFCATEIRIMLLLLLLLLLL
jgi:hypothetical protein